MAQATINRILDAINNNDANALQSVVLQGHLDLNAPDPHGYTSLQRAAQQGIVKFMKLLLAQKQLNVNAQAVG